MKFKQIVALRHCLFLAFFVVFTDVVLGQSSVLNFGVETNAAKRGAF